MPKRRVGATLRHQKLLLHMLDTGPAASGA
jgi:hypothetical protein